MASRPPAGRGISTKKASSLVCPQGNRCSSSTLQPNSSGKLPSPQGRLSHQLELSARHHLSLKPKDSGGNHLMHATHTENTYIAHITKTQTCCHRSESNKHPTLTTAARGWAVRWAPVLVDPSLAHRQGAAKGPKPHRVLVRQVPRLPSVQAL